MTAKNAAGHADRERTVFVRGGGGSAVAAEQSSEIAAGDVVFVPAGGDHALRAGPDGLECLVLDTIIHKENADG